MRLLFVIYLIFCVLGGRQDVGHLLPYVSREPRLVVGDVLLNGSLKFDGNGQLAEAANDRRGGVHVLSARLGGQLQQPAQEENSLCLSKSIVTPGKSCDSSSPIHITDEITNDLTNSRSSNLLSTHVAAMAGIESTALNGTQVKSHSATAAVARSLSSRANDTISCLDYGCVGDGSATTISAALGISTLAALQNYTGPNGTHPYALIGTGPYQIYRALPLLTTAPSGTTTLTFGTTLTVGAAGASSGATIIPLISSTGILGQLRPGMLCSGNGIATNSKALLLNPVAGNIGLSAPTTAALSSGATFSCSFDLSAILIGTVLSGSPSIAANTTVTAVNNATGVMTLSTALTGGLGINTPVEFTTEFTDAQIANTTMDWLGIQAALAVAKATHGGTVYIPRGSYNLNQELIQPDATDAIGTGQNMVSILGDGRSSATSLKWITDLGTGAYAITCQYRVSDANNCAGTWERFNIGGPNITYSMGQSATLMDGLGWSDHRVMNQVYVENFRSCLAITGDQTEFHSIITHNCYYGIEFDYPNLRGNFGNHTFTKVVVNNNTMAGIAIGPNTAPPGTTFYGDIVAGAPYCLVKETGGSTNDFLDGMTFIGMQCENIANAFFSDDRVFDAHVAYGETTTWINFQPYWNDGTWRLPGTARVAIFDFTACNQCRIEGLNQIQLWQTGTQGIFNISSTSGFIVDGDIDGLIANASSASSANITSLFSTRTSSQPNYSLWDLRAATWSGYPVAFLYQSSGSCVSYTATGSMGACSGTAAELMAGIVVGSNSPQAIVATRGVVTARTDVTVPGSNVPMRISSNGQITTASGGNDLTSQVIGNSVAPSNSGTVKIFLKPVR